MAIFSDELTIMRRFLRDPDGNIWTESDLMTYWNDAQREYAMKAGYQERVETHQWPPQWTWAHLFAWEHGYMDGDRYQALTVWQADDSVICYPWEAAYWLDTASPADEGYRFTHPWEGVQSADPADVIPLPLHFDLNEIRYFAYDNGGIPPADRTAIAMGDSHYRTASGSPVAYWMPDLESRQAVLYPRPTDFTWDVGGALHEATETYDDAGGTLEWNTDDLDQRNTGLLLETIGTDNMVTVVYQYVPRDVENWDDTLDLPEYLTKYIRCGALERAFGADTDGFMPTMRDYWKFRKEVGFRMIKKMVNLRTTDREYRLGKKGRALGHSKHPRLPSAYPSQNP